MPISPLHLANDRPRGSSAFTLVEVLIVVVILGILAAVVIPVWGEAAEDSRRQAFVSTLQNFVKVSELVNARTGTWPADSGSGDLPSEFVGLVKVDDWEDGTPIGGVWDFEYMDSAVTAAVGVHFDGGDAKDAAYMRRVDATFDDGDLNDGAFQNIASDRYYYVLAP
ncbi:MAG: prepilin-type N-terminal cleavage/methylation domain-containing protein [Planctomycetota bacterium]